MRDFDLACYFHSCAPAPKHQNVCLSVVLDSVSSSNELFAALHPGQVGYLCLEGTLVVVVKYLKGFKAP